MRLRPEGAGDFPVFAHPGLLIWAACSMAIAQGTWSAVYSCVGWDTVRAMPVARSRKTVVRGKAQG